MYVCMYVCMFLFFFVCQSDSFQTFPCLVSDFVGMYGGTDARADAREEADAEDDAEDDGDTVESVEGDPDVDGQGDAGSGRVRRVAENLRNFEVSDEEALEAHLTNRGRRRMARALQVH
jgi:hypothetical protein